MKRPRSPNSDRRDSSNYAFGTMRIKKQSTEIGLWVVLLLVVPRLPTSSLAFVNSPVMKANGRYHHIGGFFGGRVPIRIMQPQETSMMSTSFSGGIDQQ